MPSKSISYLLSKDLPVVFTNKAISGFGGFSLHRGEILSPHWSYRDLS